MPADAGVVVWLTGLPASGKTTLARRAAAALRERGRPVAILDGDEIRASLVPPPGYDDAAREAFYATLANLAAVLARQGLVVLVPATAHRRALRQRARERAGRFVEVHVATPLDECRRRDPKGLYRQGASLLPGGGHVEYEPPEAPDVVAQGGTDDAALGAVLEKIG